MKKAGLTALILLFISLPLSANKIHNFSGYYHAGKAILSWTQDTFTNIQTQRLYKRDLFSTAQKIVDMPVTRTSYTDSIPDPNIFYYYKIVLVREGLEINPSEEVEISSNKSPEKYDLIRFVNNTIRLSSPGTGIQFYYGVQAKGLAEVAILNVNREVIKVIAHGEMEAGTYLGTWDGKNSGGISVLPGLYILAVNTAGGREAKRVVVKKQ
jgi:hypothetical protein